MNRDGSNERKVGLSGPRQDTGINSPRKNDRQQVGQWLEAILEYAPINIYVKDTAGNYLWVNRQFEEFFGTDAVSVIGKPASSHLDGDSLVDAVQQDRLVIEQGHPSVQEETINGRVIRVLKCPIFGEKGDVVSVVGFDIDITEQREAEQALKVHANMLEETVAHRTAALRDSEARFRAFAESAADSFWETDAQYRFTTVQYPEDLGLTPWEQAGLSDDDHDRWVAQRALMEAHQGFREFEYRRLDKNGKHRFLAINAMPAFGSDGEFLGYRGTMRDVTTERHAQEALRQSQKMDAIGQLTGGVAHDFNNMLGVIVGNLELLAERFEGDPEQRALLDNALSSADRGSELIRRLLAFASKQPLAPRSFDLNDQISGMISVLQRTLGEAVSLKISKDAMLWHCNADPGQVESALLNLAINARDAMPDGGRLTIQTANVSVNRDEAADDNGLEAGDYVRLSVTDTGSGMSADILNQAFEPYFTTKGAGKGTGLGLSMVFGFARQSNGHAEIASEVGVGTTVTLHLPRAAPATYAATPSTAQPRSSCGETILVVEDNADVRKVTVRMLKDLGYDVLQAENGKGALSLLAAERPIDLILTDVVLPGCMSGPDIAVHAQNGFGNVKVVFMSGYALEMISNQNRPGSDVILLKKPFRKRDLAQKVSEALAQSD